MTTYKKVIPKHTTLTRSKVKLVSFCGHHTSPEGKITVLVQHKCKYYPVEFQVVDKQHQTPIIGVLTCQDLGLVKRMHSLETQSDILKSYPEVFEGLDCIPVNHHIELDPNVKPTVHPPKRVPQAIRDRVTK